MSTQPKSDLGFLVISLSRKYRSKSLVGYLKNKTNNHFHIPGILENLDSSREKKGQGRKNYTLSKSELACSLSHIKARQYGLSLNSEWIFVFEDDAIILDENEFTHAIRDAINTFDCNKPIAISFFPAQYGVFRKIKKTKNFLKVYKVPDYSVATLYSRKALSIANLSIDKQIHSIPDWSKFLKHNLQWFAVSDCSIDHPTLDDTESPSYIQQERFERHAKLKESSYQIVSRLRYLLFSGIKFFSKSYVGGTIASEKLRSRILRF